MARARGHYLEALALADELGMRPLAARGHLGLGRLARRAGDVAEAEQHLATARELFQEMRMTFWLERMGLEQVSPAVPGRPEI